MTPYHNIKSKICLGGSWQFKNVPEKIHLRPKCLALNIVINSTQ